MGFAEEALRGDAARVTLEYEDGRVLVGCAYVTDFRVEAGTIETVSRSGFLARTPGPKRWSLILKGIKGVDLLHSRREDYIADAVQPARSASEWKCDRCGTAWPRAVNRCGACGFWRPFVYE